jgi:hypothetical protein
VPLGSQQQLETVTAVAEVTTKSTVAGTLVILLLNGQLANVWGMINTLQLLSFVVYMDLFLPANTKGFLDFTVEIAEFEYFDVNPVYKALFGWAYEIDQSL